MGSADVRAETPPSSAETLAATAALVTADSQRAKPSVSRVPAAVGGDAESDPNP
jgi:hypothetical protein